MNIKSVFGIFVALSNLVSSIILILKMANRSDLKNDFSQ